MSFDNESHMHDVSGAGQDCAFTYDGDGRRMTADWGLGEVRFIHDEITGNLLAEYTLKSSTFTLVTVNTWGVGLLSTNRGGTQRSFNFDGIGSTAALTDGGEVVQDTHLISAFGIQESSTGASANPVRFIGQWGYYDDSARGSGYGFMRFLVSYY